ncbi:MAG: fructosamine kinase family protein, partial [Nitrospinaceae bacterium]|nr:fructosamine kinase family protein [Nitrospinaceae bacterium]NIR56742.1 fructosamine kinase family protein [Nitrospinaceae bacterium]NIS87191.1 fructosamine kinase family protein [Nitrospinaceae bacterium]NIT84060.1 fructosamine kinase family protein [Nitrospinaceae bacterium]NIU46243.1 fructosamine kinase family protein [Nitrospinaceae bacterium]
GYEERKSIYNLYHLLNHLNLFGGSYLGSVTAAVTPFVR